MSLGVFLDILSKGELTSLQEIFFSPLILSRPAKGPANRSADTTIQPQFPKTPFKHKPSNKKEPKKSKKPENNIPHLHFPSFYTFYVLYDCSGEREYKIRSYLIISDESEKFHQKEKKSGKGLKQQRQQRETQTPCLM